MGFKPFLVFLSLYKGVGVNEGSEIDVFVWCRSCRANRVIFSVNSIFDKNDLKTLK